MFLFAVVPLQLTCCVKDSEGRTALWVNENPSSPNTCMPLKFLFIQENKENTLTEVDRTERERQNLRPFETTINGKLH